MFNSKKEGLRVLALTAVFGWAFFVPVKSVSADMLLQKFEAENGTLSTEIKTKTELGITYIETSTTNAGTATYTVNISDTDAATNNNSGYYRIKARVLGMYDDSDCFYFNVDGQPASYYKWDIPRMAPPLDAASRAVKLEDWKVVDAQARPAAGGVGAGLLGYPYEFYLSPGTHIIAIRGGELARRTNENWLLPYYTGRIDWLEIVRIDTPAKKWEPYEIRLTSNTVFANAYVEDASINAAFIHSTGMTMNVKGFWNGKTPDGKDKFMVRFTPTEEGVWTYNITAKNNLNQAINDPGINNISGTLNAGPAASGNRGFLRVDKDNNQTSFVYDDGTRFLVVGTTAYSIMKNVMEVFGREEWKDSIDFFSLHGITKIRFLLFPMKNGHPQGYEDNLPFDNYSGTPNLDKIRVGYWQQVEELIKYMASKGIVADIILRYDAQRQFGPDTAAGNKQNDRYINYAISRLAAYPNVMWCLNNEYNQWNEIDAGGELDPNYSKYLTPLYQNYVGNLVKNLDSWHYSKEQFRRPLSVHGGGGIKPGIFNFFNEAWSSYAIIFVPTSIGKDVSSKVLELEPYVLNASQDIYESRIKSEELGNFAITPNLNPIYNSGHAMPVVNDEFGYVGESTDRAGNRKIMWGIYTAGGHGSMGDAFTEIGTSSHCEYYQSTSDSDAGNRKNWRSGKYFYGDSTNKYSGRATGCGTNMKGAYDDMKRLNDFFTTEGIEYWKMQTHNELIAGQKQLTHAYALANPGVDYVVYDADGGEFTINLEAGRYELTKFSPRSDDAPNDLENIIGVVSGGAYTYNSLDNKDWVYRFKKTGSDGPCTLQSAAWSKTSAVEGQQVNLVIAGDDNCGARELSFQVKEYDSLSKNDLIIPNPPIANVYFSGNTATATWNVEWHNDVLIGKDDPEYFFTATLTENQGDLQTEISSSANSLLSVTEDTAPPSAPTNLISTNFTYNKVDLSWNAATDNGRVASYKIYRNGAVITTVNSPQTTYSDTTTASNTAYTYQVSAVDAVNLESGKSDTLSILTKKADPLRFEGEAANTPLDSFLQISNDTAASQGKYIESTAGNDYCVNSGSANYTVNVETAGKYKITARTFSYDPGTGSRDSFCVQVDNGTVTRWKTNYISQRNNFWEENDVNDSLSTAKNVVIYNLAAGPHTVSFKGRSPLTRLDYFYLQPYGFTSQCMDGIDNDNDGLKDYGTAATNDHGCDYPTDNDETDTLPPFAKADIDHNRVVNIKDIQACIKVITGSNMTYEDQCSVLAPPTDRTNIKDIQVIIREIIN